MNTNEKSEPSIITIDPGSKGALATFNSVGQIITYPIDQAKEMLSYYQPTGARVVCEDVRFISPGVKAKVFLAEQMGYFRGLCDVFGHGFETISPQIWQAYYGFKRCTPKRLEKGGCDEEQTQPEFKQWMCDYANATLTYVNPFDLQDCDAALILNYVSKM